MRLDVHGKTIRAPDRPMRPLSVIEQHDRRLDIDLAVPTLRVGRVDHVMDEILRQLAQGRLTCRAQKQHGAGQSTVLLVDQPNRSVNPGAIGKSRRHRGGRQGPADLRSDLRACTYSGPVPVPTGLAVPPISAAISFRSSGTLFSALVQPIRNPLV